MYEIPEAPTTQIQNNNGTVISYLDSFEYCTTVPGLRFSTEKTYYSRARNMISDFEVRNDVNYSPITVYSSRKDFVFTTKTGARKRNTSYGRAIVFGF